MISNNLILAAASASGYGQYQAPPTYLWGTGTSAFGGLDDGINASEFKEVNNGSGYSNIIAGDSSTMAVKSNGTLWAWGVNSSGRLGNNSTSIISSPIQIGTLTNWTSNISLSKAGSHTIAVKTDGTLWAWGANDTSIGQLGLNDTNIRLSPVQVGTLTNWMTVATGRTHSCAVKTNGTIWTWGRNTVGELGDGTVVSKSSPIQVGTLTDWSNISAGSSFTVAVKTDGTLWAWGWNSIGQLGLGDRTNRSSPVQIGTLTDWLAVSCGISHTMAIKQDGTLWGWGENVGKLGDGTGTNRSSPVQIGTLTDWTSVSAGGEHTVATRSGGSLWVWGSNFSSTLGLNHGNSISSPIQVGTLTGWTNISAGNTHTVVIKDEVIYSTGNTGDPFGSLNSALGRVVLYSSPIQIPNFTNASFVEGGTGCAYVIKTDGSLWVWGRNSANNLGLDSLGKDANGRAINFTSPVQVGTLTNWKYLKFGSGFSVLAIKTDGSLWSWGLNSSGQLGLGDTSPRSSPVQVGTLTDWANVAAGQDHTAAVKTDGTLWTWGRGAGGGLGSGATTSRSSPVQVGTLTNWSKVSAGDSYTMAVKTDGTLWSWGNNIAGQLGHSSGLNVSSPVQIGTLTDWRDVECGYRTTIALKTNGTIWSWGQNSSGEMGSNTFGGSRNSPVQIGTLTNWAKISTKWQHSIAVKTDGTLWGWGGNFDGRIGNNSSTTSFSSPVQIGTLTNWISGSVGTDISFFIA